MENTKTVQEMFYSDKNGTIAKEGLIVTGLYEKGDDTGVIIRDEYGQLAVKDSDGDILEIESALKVGIIKQYNTNNPKKKEG